ncbi:serine hydrolase [Psychrosphaera sp. 1_MG-2023]|uniref:serine hydrolase n=1 Tax=Psychrosphaera sp. 1_MG-2023 TaxID=3062643 RepID=UPI0026E3818D|nr:serine hydrolase [Psychrosphaera sp. 1_MG-2023]MDO6721010.1 serine hydrolase [Psychrosphaera sp. 1_MG-2023]
MPKLTKLVALTSSLLLCSSLLSAANIDTKLIEQHLQTRVSEGSVGVGLVVAVVDGKQDKIIAVGKANKTNSMALNKSSLFEIGSISKTFTGLLLADMVIKGELNLDDPVSKYLPKGVSMPTRNDKQITLLHLATHTSGLPRLPTDFKPKDMTNPYADYSVDMMYDFLSNYHLPRDIGQTPEYSNLGVGLLGHVLALKAGKSYEDLVKERILKILGMDNTTITISAAQQKQLTTGHDVSGNPTPHWDFPTLPGAGALRSSGADMLIFLKANMGLLDSPLAAAIDLTHKFQHSFGNDTLSIGLNWIIANTPAGDVIVHDGGTGGYRSFIGFNKTSNLGVVVLANSQDAPDAIGQAVLTGKIDSIKMVVTEEVTLSKQELTALTGDYQLAPNFIITISEAGGRLFAQATGQQKLPIFAKSKNEFFYKAVKASFTFNKNKEGKVDSLVLHQNGNHPAKRID